MILVWRFSIADIINKWSLYVGICGMAYSMLLICLLLALFTHLLQFNWTILVAVLLFRSPSNVICCLAIQMHLMEPWKYTHTHTMHTHTLWVYLERRMTNHSHQTVYTANYKENLINRHFCIAQISNWNNSHASLLHCIQSMYSIICKWYFKWKYCIYANGNSLQCAI